MPDVTVRALGPDDRSWVRSLIRERWGSTSVVSRGVLHQADALAGFIAEVDGCPNGLITFDIRGDACEIVTLDSLLERQGIASTLINAVRDAALASGCTRVWLITTNDNERAIQFYKDRGFKLVAVHADAVRESRTLKPEIPLVGFNGIAVRDELEFEQPVVKGRAS